VSGTHRLFLRILNGAPESSRGVTSRRLAPSATLAVARQSQGLKAAVSPSLLRARRTGLRNSCSHSEAAAKACYDPVNYKYTPTAGLAELREAIVAKSMRDSGLRTTPGQVLVTNGGKHAIITAMMTKLNPVTRCSFPHRIGRRTPRRCTSPVGDRCRS